MLLGDIALSPFCLQPSIPHSTWISPHIPADKQCLLSSTINSSASALVSPLLSCTLSSTTHVFYLTLWNKTKPKHQQLTQMTFSGKSWSFYVGKKKSITSSYFLSFIFLYDFLSFFSTMVFEDVAFCVQNKTTYKVVEANFLYTISQTLCKVYAGSKVYKT